MWTRRGFTGLAAAAATAGAARAAPEGGGRAAEATALRRFAERTHPNGLAASQDAGWRASWDDLAGRADTLNDGQYICGLRRALAWFKDGHTTVLPFEFVGGAPAPYDKGPFGLSYPLRAKPFHDGLWVTDAKDEAAPLLGARIVRAGGQPIERIAAAHVASWTGENPAWGHNWLSLLFHYAGQLQGLGVIQDPAAPLTIEAATADGRAVAARVTARPDGDKNRIALRRALTRQEGFAAEAGRGNFIKVLPGGAGYLSIDEMADADGFTFDQLLDATMAAVRSPGITRLVIDLRRNGGGDNTLGEPLRRELARSSLNRPGGLYVMTSPQTFSAAQNLANRLERETFALFVGEPTGSAPNLHGDASFFRRDVAGAVPAMVSTLRWYDGGPQDHRRWIFPDLPAPNLFADWAAGRDPALDAALAHSPQARDDFRDRARYFERPSQKGEWKPFWTQGQAA